VKVGLIPPRGLENYALRSKFHLALAIPELMSRRTYGGMYLRLSKTGDFVVLDNGLAEGKPATPEQLLAYADWMHADEVVVPDVMRDATGTIKAVEGFFKNFSPPTTRQYMAVAQGERNEDYFKCVDLFATIPAITTVGIPRHMLETLGVKATRIDFAHWINEMFPRRFELHFLGTNPVWMAETRHATKYAPFVRSVDSSMPFSYAIAGEHLANDTQKQITRPDKYFDTEWVHKVDGGMIRNNISVFMEWADATNTRSQASASKLRSVSTT